MSNFIVSKKSWCQVIDNYIEPWLSENFRDDVDAIIALVSACLAEEFSGLTDDSSPGISDERCVIAYAFFKRLMGDDLSNAELSGSVCLKQIDDAVALYRSEAGPALLGHSKSGASAPPNYPLDDLTGLPLDLFADSGHSANASLTSSVCIKTLYRLITQTLRSLGCTYSTLMSAQNPEPTATRVISLDAPPLHNHIAQTAEITTNSVKSR